MELADALRQRRSTKSFDTSYEIDDASLARIFALVRTSPSSFNLQHTRFVVVRDEERRRALQAASYGQKHVGECSAVVVVCAKLAAHEDAARTNAHAPQEVLDGLVPIIERSYAGRDEFQRDEAIRSASLASMTLMLVAQAEGLNTCPMIGYDPDEVEDIVRLDEGHIPVMLVVIGKGVEGAVFPTSRLPLSETVRLEAFDGAGLSAADDD